MTIVRDIEARKLAWRQAKQGVFEMCQSLHRKQVPWEFAFNVCWEAVKLGTLKDLGVEPGDVELWCKEAYELFEDEQ